MIIISIWNYALK